MPELPEVEMIKRSLAPHLGGKTIERVVFHWPRTCVGDPDETSAQLADQRIDKLGRYGKYLLFHLSKHSRGSFLWIHLRMTGNLLLNAQSGPHTRAEMFLSGATTVVFHDIRKFGKWQWSRDFPERLTQLGPEPLEIDAEGFVKRLAGRSTRLKALLLNQEFLRGLGNIYADEALFRAKLHPERSAASVSPRKARALHKAIRDVLQEAISAGGTSISNYVDGQGSPGYFQLHTQVYAKTGQPCANCGAPLRRMIVAQRSTHFCPRCQRR